MYQPREALERETRSDEEHQRDRELRHDERAGDPAAERGRAARAVGEPMSERRPARAQRGQQAAREAGEDTRRRRRGEDASIVTQLVEAWDVEARESREQVDHPLREQKPKRRADR